MPKQRRPAVNAMKMDSVIAHMRALRGTPAYEVFIGALGIERAKIIEAGKKANEMQARADAFLRLDGFDTAFGLISKYANMKTTEEKDLPDSPLND